MSYSIEIKKEENFLHARISGKRTREAVSALSKEILDASIQFEIDEILVDARDMTGRLSIFDSYLIITKEFPRLKRSVAHKKVAIVDIKENFERLRFFERVSRKLGYNIRTFIDIDLAINHLCKARSHAVK